MGRIRYLFPLGAFLLVMSPVSSDAQSVVMEYLLSVKFQCINSYTDKGESVYVVGDIEALGRWKVGEAVKLDPPPGLTTRGPAIWTGTVQLKGTKPDDVVKWKCIVRSEADPTAVIRWQPDPDNQMKLIFGDMKTTGSF
ncbi:carbohydrate-binding module family 20 domain-containing protein [Pseudomonas sp. S2_F03]